MGPLVILSAAAATGLASWALSGWVRALAGPGSRWVRPGFHAVLAGVLAAGAGALARGWLELMAFGVLALACSLLVVVDLATHRLPDAIIGPTWLAVLAAFTVAAVAGDRWVDLGRAVLAGFGVALAFFLLALAAPAGLGLGDVKLAGLLGAFLGWQGWPQVLVGTLAAFVVNGVLVALLLLSGKVTRSSAVAFGPWLVLGAVLASAWGAQT